MPNLSRRHFLYQLVGTTLATAVPKELHMPIAPKEITTPTLPKIDLSKEWYPVNYVGGMDKWMNARKALVEQMSLDAELLSKETFAEIMPTGLSGYMKNLEMRVKHMAIDSAKGVEQAFCLSLPKDIQSQEQFQWACDQVRGHAQANGLFAENGRPTTKEILKESQLVYENRATPDVLEQKIRLQINKSLDRVIEKASEIEAELDKEKSIASRLQSPDSVRVDKKISGEHGYNIYYEKQGYSSHNDNRRELLDYIERLEGEFPGQIRITHEVNRHRSTYVAHPPEGSEADIYLDNRARHIPYEAAERTRKTAEESNIAERELTLKTERLLAERAAKSAPAAQVEESKPVASEPRKTTGRISFGFGPSNGGGRGA